MAVMLRTLAVVVLVFGPAQVAARQAPSVLHIKVVLADAAQKATPVSRHALLISENPASAAPRRVVTGLDGTADVRLRPGNYTVESDRPATFGGKSYQWTQTVDIAAGRDAVLELTADNAEVELVGAATDASFLFPQWQDSVVALWTPTTHASGFVIDSSGLIATNQRVVGTASSAEVQLGRDVKVAASVLAADPVRDVAILWIDPTVIASVRPVPLSCKQAAPTVADGQEIFTIVAPLRQSKGMTSGTVERVDSQGIVSDLTLPKGSAGGPLFSASGALIGITSLADDSDQSRNAEVRIVRTAGACDVVAAAEKKMKTAAPPAGTHLPVEPVQPFPVEALEQAVRGRAGSLNPYQISSSTFDIAFITPVLTYGTHDQLEQLRNRTDKGLPDPRPELVRPLMEFSNWSEYVWDFPPVLLVRVTPKLTEGFWTTVARAAARTQGVALPPIKRFKSGFSRMRAFCGETEITPIHPFRLQTRISESDAIHEGLYVFHPTALGPQCSTVTLVLHSEKEPGAGEKRVVDPKVIQQIWEDFAPWRRVQ